MKNWPKVGKNEKMGCRRQTLGQKEIDFPCTICRFLGISSAFLVRPRPTPVGAKFRQASFRMRVNEQAVWIPGGRKGTPSLVGESAAPPPGILHGPDPIRTQNQPPKSLVWVPDCRYHPFGEDRSLFCACWTKKAGAFPIAHPKPKFSVQTFKRHFPQRNQILRTFAEWR